MSGYGLEKRFHLSTILEKSLKEQGFNVKVINAKCLWGHNIWWTK